MSTAVRAGGLTFLFALTLFTSASLLFIVEPMALPLLACRTSNCNASHAGA